MSLRGVFSGHPRGRVMRGASALFADPLQSAAKRVQILAVIVAWMLGVNLTLFSVMPEIVDFELGSPFGLLDQMLMGLFALSVVVFFLARSKRLSPQAMLDTGLGYVVAIGLIMSVGMQGATDYLYLPRNGVSETVVLILIFPTIIPNAPWKVAITALSIATLDPVGVMLFGDHVAEDAPGCATCFTTADLVGAYYFNYIAVALAMAPLRIIRALSRDVSRARELGSYQLGERLGAGGMGEVYRATHRFLAREAAIKLIHADSLGHHADPDGARVRFEREAQATANLHSPHTIQLYDFGVAEDGTFYYVMELLRGFDVQTLVTRFGPVSASRAVAILIGICDSLADAHQSRYVHRDVKPANVFVCHYGHRYDFVKVLDFGLVKELSTPDSGLTQANAVPGTPSTIAPETLDGHDADPRSDLYAVGCVAYWLLTGQTVFDHDSPVKMLAAHLTETPVPPSERTELPVPDELERIVLDCLAKDPAARPASASELSRRLAACPEESTWTEARAAEWWKRNAPDGGGPGSDPSRERTLVLKGS